MPGKVSLTTIGNWNKEVGVGLGSALAVSMDVMGRTGQEACKHALILMGQSATALTKQSKKKRPIVGNPDKRWKIDRRRAPYGVMAPKGKGAARKMTFKPIFRTKEFGGVRFFDKKSTSWFEHFGQDANTWRKVASGEDPGSGVVVPGIKTDRRRNIGRRGLAKSSWQWGLRVLGARARIVQKQLSGVTEVHALTSDKINGYILSNKLRYIQDAMKPGWETIVQLKATNKIMAQARNKMENKWRREMGMPKRGRKDPHASNQQIASYFLKGLK